ncbi:MAG: AAA family ATPase [Treponema sp.]|nr:AAA family ATPase [Treponema sp.]MBO6219597.1 AAA family ATPase [Treponema sp.]
MSKIEEINIKNLAVFKDFVWKNSVKTKDGQNIFLSDINIFYGRNYSGKTTLSRIFRSFETGVISDKYQSPEFSLKIKGEKEEITQKNICNKRNIRVFNEDFIKENLSFIVDPDKEIKSFAILGDDNNRIISEIERLKSELGENEEGKQKTGLYKSQEEAQSQFTDANSEYIRASQNLEAQLKTEATDSKKGIKYQSDLFGDQNYTIAKLKNEINKVLDNSYKQISSEEEEKLKALLKEEIKSVISKKTDVLNYISLSASVKELVERKIEASQKIQELVENSLLNEWVKRGKEVQKGRTICAFCGNPISSERWNLLQKHFNEEVDKLDIDSTNLINKLDAEISHIEKICTINENSFYTEQQKSLFEIKNKYSNFLDLYKKAITQLKEKVNYKCKHVFETIEFSDSNNSISDFDIIKEEYNALVSEANDYAKELDSKKKNAQEELRLNEIFNFLQTINYSTQKADIDLKKSIVNEKQSMLDDINTKINNLLVLLSQKQEELNDEEKGARKVNEYLSNFFGNNSLQLKAVRKEDIQEEDDERHLYFEIQRNGEKAYNMSEGECSLVAFCYFMAKLDDVNTSGIKPIIWIDDPISSLDSNHIFFMYSLISEKIALNNNFEQLFISTHNLDFLKYLKRLKCNFLQKDSKAIPTNKTYFIIARNGSYSTIRVMPQYMKDFVTEFNYLFNEIYKCANIENPSDENYSSIYNFGNNARKFLEIYLFYKFPDDTDEREKQLKFFDSSELPVFLNERINNEYSHLNGDIERAALPTEVPEIKRDAQLILNRLKELDLEQYNALLNSIGVTVESTSS